MSVLTIEYLSDLCTRAHTAAKAAGWYDGGPRPWAELMALVHTELAEMTEAYRKGNPPDEHCPEFASASIELADTVIRMADALGAHGALFGGYQGSDENLLGHSPIEDAAWLHGVVKTQYLGCASINYDTSTVTACFQYADKYNIDLPSAIEAKMAYNRTRPHRHGGKVY